MNLKKITLYLSLLLCTTECNLKASESYSVSTKTIIAAASLTLISGLLLWKKTYITNYLWCKIFDYDLHQACRDNNIEAVKILLSDPNINPNQPEYDTPLYVACQQNNKNIVQFLLNHPSINPNQYYCLSKTDTEKRKEKCFVKILENISTDIAELIFNHKNFYIDEYIHDYLFNSSKGVKIIRLLLSCPNFNPNIKTRYDMTLLDFACMKNNIPIITLLLADPKTDPITGLISSLHSSIEILQLLLTDPKTISNAKNYYDNLLITAICSDNLLNNPKVKNILISKTYYLDEDESYKDLFGDKYQKEALYFARRHMLNFDINYLICKETNNHKNFLTKFLYKTLHQNYRVGNDHDIIAFITWCHDEGANLCARNNNKERAIDIAEKQFHQLNPNIIFREHYEKYTYQETIYYHLLRKTPDYSDGILHAYLKKNIIDSDACKKIIAYYKLLTIDKDMARRSCFTHNMLTRQINSYEKIYHLNKPLIDSFKKNFFTARYKGLLPYLPPLEKLSLC